MGTVAERLPLRSGFGAAAAVLAALALLLALRAPGGVNHLDPPTEASIAEAPLSFEPAEGRFGRGVDFVSRSVAGGSLYLGAGEAALAVASRRGTRTLRLEFLGANPAAEPVPLGKLPGKANSFIGDDPSRWRTGIPTYAAVRYRSIYPGVGLEFHGDQRALEYDFRLAPGADPTRLAIGLSGADSLRVDRSGDLLIDLGPATVRQHAPVAYQWIGGERRLVDVAFELRSSNLRFRLGAYDRDRHLVIDPVLTYSTYLGGSLDDATVDVAVDDEGAAYVTGLTDSADLPLEDHVRPDQALMDAFVTKFNPAADGESVTLAYSTYLGASGNEIGGSIEVDDEGAAYVSGSTASVNFPTVDPIGGPAGGDLGSTDAFVTKLSPDAGGTVQIAYSTYLSGSGTESGANIAVDASGAAYLTGSTDSTDFLAFNNFQGDQKDGDIFLTRIAPDNGGQAIVSYSTYIGGTANQERAADVAVDELGAVYIAGYTDGADFPTQDPFETDDGGFDALAIKVFPFTGAPVALAYSTYLGGANGDFAIGIAVGQDGAATVVGTTESSDFPEVLAFESDQSGDDAFVTEIAPDGGGPVALSYSTYLGGGLADTAQGVAIDSEGDAVVIGDTLSSEFPVSIEPLFENQGGRDAFVTELTHEPGRNAEAPFSTYLGGSGVEEATGVAIDPEGAIYVSGATGSADFPTRGAFQGDQGVRDTFLTKLGEPPVPVAPQAGSGGAPRDQVAPDTIMVKRPNRTVRTRRKRARVKFRFDSTEGGSRFECSLNRGSFARCPSPQAYHLPAKAKGSHRFRVRAVDAAGNVDPSPAEARVRVRRLAHPG